MGYSQGLMQVKENAGEITFDEIGEATAYALGNIFLAIALVIVLIAWFWFLGKIVTEGGKCIIKSVTRIILETKREVENEK